jgi:hypothetical protein
VCVCVCVCVYADMPANYHSSHDTNTNTHTHIPTHTHMISRRAHVSRFLRSADHVSLIIKSRSQLYSKYAMTNHYKTDLEGGEAPKVVIKQKEKSLSPPLLLFPESVAEQTRGGTKVGLREKRRMKVGPKKGRWIKCPWRMGRVENLKSQCPVIFPT